MSGPRSHGAFAGGSEIRASFCPSDLSPLFPHSFQGRPPSFHDGPAGACFQIWEETTKPSHEGLPKGFRVSARLSFVARSFFAVGAVLCTEAVGQWPWPPAAKGQ